MGVEVYYVAVCDECRKEGPMEDTERGAVSYGFKWVNNCLYCSTCAETKAQKEE